MKRVILLIFAVVFLFGLAACNPDDPDTKNSDDTYNNSALVN